MFADAKAKFKEHMLNLWEGFEDRFPNLAGFLVNVKNAFISVKDRIKEFFGSLGERWDNFKEMVTTFSISEWLGNRKDDFFDKMFVRLTGKTDYHRLNIPNWK